MSTRSKNLRQFKKSDFPVECGTDGVEYVIKSVDELSKNRRENIKAQDGA